MSIFLSNNGIAFAHHAQYSGAECKFYHTGTYVGFRIDSHNFYYHFDTLCIWRKAMFGCKPNYIKHTYQYTGYLQIKSYDVWSYGFVRSRTYKYCTIHILYYVRAAVQVHNKYNKYNSPLFRPRSFVTVLTYRCFLILRYKIYRFNNN